MEKKSWGKPELVVLVRSKPEEGVLTQCKVVGALVGPGVDSQGCGDVLTNCGACQARGGGAS